MGQYPSVILLEKKVKSNSSEQLQFILICYNLLSRNICFIYQDNFLFDKKLEISAKISTQKRHFNLCSTGHMRCAGSTDNSNQTIPPRLRRFCLWFYARIFLSISCWLYSFLFTNIFDSDNYFITVVFYSLFHNFQIICS